MAVARGARRPLAGHGPYANSHTGKCVAEKSADLFRVCLLLSTRASHFISKVCLTFFNQGTVDPD
jgi:hypothetical protein